jgi:hypothetical protein
LELNNMNKKSQPSASQNADIKKSLKSNEINHIYFNEFSIGTSSNDVFIILMCHGREEAVLNLSHITAKSLASSLANSIHNFEEATGQQILELNESVKLR